MGGMRITELDFVRLLPAFMQDDEAVIALCKAVDNLIGEPAKRLSTIRTWDKIDELNEAELDELAWELDIDWYDSTGMGLEEKRETIKLAQQIKRKRGTKWAVEQLITAYFGSGSVTEWFNNGGDPYTFVATTPNTAIDEGSIERFTAAVNAAKNARSHMVEILYYWKQGPEPGVEFALGTSRHCYGFTKCGTKERPAMVGILMKHGYETEPEETPHLYSLPATGEKISGTYPRAAKVGTAVKAAAAAEPTISHAVYVYPKCGENCITTSVARVGTAIVGMSVTA